MTTYARGVPAPKRAVGAIHFGNPAIDRKAVAETNHETRSMRTAAAAERHATQREQAWIDRAAFAGLRMIPRG